MGDLLKCADGRGENYQFVKMVEIMVWRGACRDRSKGGRGARVGGRRSEEGEGGGGRAHGGRGADVVHQLGAEERGNLEYK